MMHLAMDAEGDVLAVEITDTGTGDSSGLDLLLPQVGKIDRLIADTAYYQIERNEQLLACWRPSRHAAVAPSSSCCAAA